MFNQIQEYNIHLANFLNLLKKTKKLSYSYQKVLKSPRILSGLLNFFVLLILLTGFSLIFVQGQVANTTLFNQTNATINQTDTSDPLENTTIIENQTINSLEANITTNSSSINSTTTVTTTLENTSTLNSTTTQVTSTSTLEPTTSTETSTTQETSTSLKTTTTATSTISTITTTSTTSTTTTIQEIIEAQTAPEINDEVKDNENKTVGKKIQDEPDYETFFTFVGKEENNFVIRFYHNSTTSLPVWIEGDIDYELSTKEAEPLEVVNLTVPLVNDEVPNFKLHVGYDSDVFEFGITIITVQSYPIVGDNWTVEFNTTGTADLKISAIKGTEFGKDLQFLEIKCGDEILDYEWINKSIFIQDYSCDTKGFEISKVLTSGKHHLEFDFGGIKAYAHNQAGVFRMEWGNVSVSGTSWKTVELENSYENPIIVVSPEYNDLGAGHDGTEVWARNITANSFEVHAANENFDTTDDTMVHYIVMEEGNWTLPDSNIKVEAGNFSTDKYGYAGSWGCGTGHGEQVTFTTSFDDSYPLVLISRASNNDPNWWGGAYCHKYDTYGSEVSSSDGSMCAGLDQNRIAGSHYAPTTAERIDYILMDSGNGTLDGVEFEILMSGTTVWMEGYADSPPYQRAWQHLWAGTPSVIVGGKTAIHGSDGSWVVVYDTGDTSYLRAFVDEGDERAHGGTESGGAWAFAEPGSYSSNEAPTSPDDITCDGGSCNITVDESVVLNASGSIDSDGDNITYFIEAALENITSEDQESGEQQIKAVEFGLNYNDSIMDLNPDFRWLLNGNEDDMVGTHNSDGGSDPNWVSNIIPNSDYSQCGDYIPNDESHYPNDAKINDGTTYKKSISMWIEADTIDTSNNGRIIWEEGGGTNWFDVYVHEESGEDRVYCTVGEGGSGGTVDYVYEPIQTGALYHVVCTLDCTAEELHLYVNGTLVDSDASLAIGNALSSHTSNPAIGGADGDPRGWDQGSVSGNFDGRIADVVYWGEQDVLTSTEIGTIYEAGMGGEDDIEATKDWETYPDISSNYWKFISRINFTVNISSYDNSGSIENNNNNPDLQIEVYNSTAWVEIGNYSISSTGNSSLSTTDPIILEAWKDEENRDFRIRGIDFDYNDSSNYDEINYTDVWVTIDGKNWVETGNHTNETTLNWDTSNIPYQTCIDLRTRAIDLGGSDSYSDYFTEGCCLNISDRSPPKWYDNTTSIDSDLEYNPDKSYIFNVTWNETEKSVDIVFIEHNFTGSSTLHNDTVTTKNGDNYYFDAGNLGSGAYFWKWYSSNEDDYWNSTDQWTYTVVKNQTNPVDLYFRNSTGTFKNQNMTIYYEELVNATGVTSYSNSGQIKLYRDEEDVTPENKQEILLGVNTQGYQYKVNTTGNQNYTENSTGAEYYLFINKKQTETHLLINDTRANYGVTKDDNVNFTVELFNYPGKGVELWTNYSDGVWKLWDSGSSPLENITKMSTKSKFEFLGNYSGNDNYTYSEESWLVTVSELNLESKIQDISPLSINQSENSTILANCSCSGGVCNNVYMELQKDLNLIPTESGNDLQVNGTNPYYIGTLNDGEWSTNTWNITGWNPGDYEITVKCNSTETGNIFSDAQVLEVNDTEDPNWSNNKTSPLSGIEYLKNRAYRFNITWNDNDEIDTVLIEHNFTGSGLQNDTVTNNENGEYYFDVSDLAVGTYVWKWYANDTTDNQNSTDQWIYNIIKNQTNPVDVYLINSTHTYKNQDMEIIYGEQTEANVTQVYSDSGTVNLYRNQTSISNPEITTLNAGVYSYKGNITGNNNYTSNFTGTSSDLIVNRAPSSCNLSSSNSWSYGYGEFTTLICECNGDGTPHLYFNDELHDEYNDTGMIFSANPSGHEVVCNITQGNNYQSSSNSSTLTISKKPTVMTVYLNQSENNQSVEYTSALNMNGAISGVEYSLTVYLDLNDTSFGNEFDVGTDTITNISPTTDLSDWSAPNNVTYNLTAHFNGDENHTSSFDTLLFHVFDSTEVNPVPNTNSTNSTNPGEPIEHRLKWSDEVGLSGYVFSFCNGTYNGTDCLKTLGETHNISFSNCEWKTVEFNNSYSKPPVVYGTAVSQALGGDDDYNSVIPTIDMVNKTHMNVSICVDNGTAQCDCYATPELVHFYVLDKDSMDDLGWIDWGTISDLTPDESTTGVSYGPFDNNAVVFTSPQTYNQEGNVTAVGWFGSYPDTDSATLYPCVHPAPDLGMHEDYCGYNATLGQTTPTEDYAWVAFDPYRAEELINTFEWGTDDISNSAWVSISYSKTKPVILVTQNSEDGGQDVKYARARDVYGTPEFGYCEQDGGLPGDTDACNSHNPENMYWFAIEDGNIITIDGWVNDTWAEFPNGGTEDWSNVTKVVDDTTGSTMAWRIYANDTSDNWNSSEIFSYTTEDNQEPIWSNLGSNTSYPSKNQAVEFYTYWTDDYSLKNWTFSWNLTTDGHWENVTTQDFSGQGNWSNTTQAIPSFANGTYSYKFYAFDEIGNSNVTDEANITISGSLEVNLIYPPPSIYMALHSNITVNATVYCRDGYCWDVNATLRYNSTGVNPDTPISTIEGEAPFYIQETQPLSMKSCPTNPLNEDEYCNLTWVINATGSSDTDWKVGVLFNSSVNDVQENHTSNSTITIVECFDDISVNWNSIDFGNMMTNTNWNPALGNSNNEYNISSHEWSCNLDLWINGTDFENTTYSSVIGVGNMTWNKTGDVSSRTLKYDYELIESDMERNTNLTTYYWFNLPPVYKGNYNGNLTIKTNDTE